MYLNLAHYFFTTIASPDGLKAELEQRLAGTSVVGTILIALEGTNCNLAGEETELLAFAREYFSKLGCQDFDFRLSWSEIQPYRHLKLKVKPEIVTMGVVNLDVAGLKSPHIKPEDFKELLRNPGDTQIIDTRNDFEFEMGSFRGAQNPRMRSFRDFPAIADKLDKTKPVVMFCTGGIRCEKASAYLRRSGFEQVRQLEGGILRYLTQYGKDNFHGDCFVFDERVRFPIPSREDPEI